MAPLFLHVFLSQRKFFALQVTIKSRKGSKRKTEKLLSFSMSFPRISSHFFHSFLENRRAQRFVSSIGNMNVESGTAANRVLAVQSQDAKKNLIGRILFLYYEESLVS